MAFPTRSSLIYHCGIDVGSSTLSFSFLSTDMKRLITYMGSLEETILFEAGKEPTTLANPLANDKDAHVGDKLIALMDLMPEFRLTTHFLVERQMGGRSFAQQDGIIFGYLRGKGIQGSAVDSRLRVNFCEWLLNKEKAPIFTVEEVKLLLKEANIKRKLVLEPTLVINAGDKRETGRKVPDTKLPPMSFVRHQFTYYFNHVVAYTPKVDDICDAVTYAYMSLNRMSSSKDMTSIKRAEAKEAKALAKIASKKTLVKNALDDE